jgi:hypothetical protein
LRSGTRTGRSNGSISIWCLRLSPTNKEAIHIRVTSQNFKLFTDYELFCEKFKGKKTTDDCYTPPIVYDAVADWTAREYGLDKADFVRPFFPGEDYEKQDYTGKIVVDNPPFSMLSKIIDFFCMYDVRFLLFSPTLSGLVRYSDKCTVFPTGADIEYENGAVVPTSFVTNLDPPEIRARTVPELYAAVTAANDENRKQKQKSLPKYSYPPHLLTSAQMYPLARLGIALTIPRAESCRVAALDEQKQATGKTIFGCGWLLSDRLAAEREKAEREKAEREKAEREKAERYGMSDRERRIIEQLNRGGENHEH